MGAYQDQGIVLKGRAYREQDTLVTLFLINHGKVAAVAKGVRKPRSTLLAGLYPLSYSGFSLYRGRSSLESLTEADLIHGFGKIRDDLERIGWATLIAEVVDECFSDHDPQPEAFYVLVAGLQAMNGGRHPASVAMAAVWQLLKASGFSGQFVRCAKCQAVLAGAMYLARGETEPECAACANGRGSAHVKFSAGVVKTVNRWLAMPAEKFGGVEVRGGQIKEMVDLLTMSLAGHLGRTPRSLTFITQLLDAELEGPG
jgi:DNA repair protein RecO (recombination protein O)